MRIAQYALMAVALLAAGMAHADVTVSTEPTQNMICQAGVCSPTAADAVLNSSDLASMLAVNDTKVTTGSGAVNIDVWAGLNWNSASHLTLDANTSLNIQAPITVAGNGAVTLTYNDGGSNGDVIFSNGGSVTFDNLSSGLVINGNGYTLVGDVPTLASFIKANPSGHFALGNSYNALSLVPHRTPVKTPFNGILEGLGQTISNLSLTRTVGCVEDGTTCLGLFAYIDSAGLVRDLRLTNLRYSSKDGIAVGGLAAYNLGTVAHVYSDGSIQGVGSATGGLVGDNSGRITDSFSAVNIDNEGPFGGGGAAVGGLVGGVDKSGTVSRSGASGAMSAHDGALVGGLVGVSNGSLTQCFATGAVTVNGQDFDDAGGLAAVAFGSTNECWSSGPVTVSGTFGEVAEVGGFIGYGDTVSNSYSTGTVTGPKGQIIGGFMAFGSHVTTSYATGLVTAKSAKSGGFTGEVLNKNRYLDDYWDIDSTKREEGCGKGRCKGIIGLTDQQLTSALPVGFDPGIWAQSQSINNGYPYLITNPPK